MLERVRKYISVNRYSFLLVLLLLLSAFSCRDNSINAPSFGQRGEVTGSWQPLFINDTLEVYVNKDNSIHLGDPSFDITLIPEASATTFQVWTDSNYARDSLNVYFPIEIECDVIDGTYICYSIKYIVDGAEASSFRYLGNGFGTDGNELFLNGTLVEGNNGEGF